MRYAVGRNSPDRAESLLRCRLTATWWLSGERAELAIRDAGTGEFAGHIQLTNIAEPIGQGMVGYSLLRRFRGQGFTTRAVTLLAGWALSEVALHRLVAGTATENIASQRVLERAGFTREALLRRLLPGPGGVRHDDVQWVRLRP